MFSNRDLRKLLIPLVLEQLLTLIFGQVEQTIMDKARAFGWLGLPIGCVV